MKEIRELLVVVIGHGNYDMQYTLVRNAEAQLFVETFELPTEPFVRGSTGPTIFPADFDKHVIYGRALGDYVDAVLDRVDGCAKRQEARRSRRRGRSLSRRELRAGASVSGARNNSFGFAKF